MYNKNFIKTNFLQNFEVRANGDDSHPLARVCSSCIPVKYDSWIVFTYSKNGTADVDEDSSVELHCLKPL